jgi:hemoglobin
MAPTMATKPMKDGELAVPADYKSWPVFLAEVQRPDVKQVREIYINPIGAKATAGGQFADGTVSVMELWKAKEGPDGALMKTADGKLVKGDLAKVFVQGKFKGSGANAPEGLKNGDWVYSAYLADGKTAAPDPTAACRACHLPLGEAKDFVHRYDEYFQKRKG